MRLKVREDIERLLEIAIEKGALKYGDFTLSSGKHSSYYFDGRLLSLDPEGAFLIGKALYPLVNSSGAEAIGGPTLAADPVVTAVSITSQMNGSGIPAFIVRKEAKEHGMTNLIEGPVKPAESIGCEVVQVLAILDRREGGQEILAGHGYNFTALMAANSEGVIEVVQY